MIIAKDGKQVLIAGSVKDILTQACIAVDQALEAVEEACGENQDLYRFHAMTAAGFGGERVSKIENNEELHTQVDAMLEEVWKGFHMIEQFIDSYHPTEEEEGKVTHE